MVMKRNQVLRWACLFKAGRLSTSMALMFMAVGISFIVMLPWGRTPVLAHEDVSQERPTTTSVEEKRLPDRGVLCRKTGQAGALSTAQGPVEDTDPFFRDTTLDINLRTYYFYRDKYDDSKSEAWALGGALSYQSGWFSITSDWVPRSIPPSRSNAPDDRDGTLLLKPGQEGYTVLGQLYGRIKVFEENFINIYRYEYNTPFITSTTSA